MTFILGQDWRELYIPEKESLAFRYYEFLPVDPDNFITIDEEGYEVIPEGLFIEDTLTGQLVVVSYQEFHLPEHDEPTLEELRMFFDYWNGKGMTLWRRK